MLPPRAQPVPLNRRAYRGGVRGVGRVAHALQVRLDGHGRAVISARRFCLSNGLYLLCRARLQLYLLRERPDEHGAAQSGTPSRSPLLGVIHSSIPEHA